MACSDSSRAQVASRTMQMINVAELLLVSFSKKIIALAGVKTLDSQRLNLVGLLHMTLSKTYSF